MKLLKKLFGIKTTYAIPSNNGVDITKGKKYKFKPYNEKFGTIKDDTGFFTVIFIDKCEQINNGSWTLIKE